MDSRRGSSKRNQNEVLQPSPALYGTASSTFFSDMLFQSFLSTYAVALETTPVEMGIIRSSRNLFTNVFQMGWGSLSERFGKRLFILTGYLFSSLLTICLLVFQAPLHLLILVVVQSIIWSSAVPAWNALLGDYTKTKTRGKVLGRIGAVSRFSGVVATLTVAIIKFIAPTGMTPSSFVIPFLLSAVAGIFGALVVVFTREKRRDKTSRKWVDMIAPMQDHNFRPFLIANGLHWFAMAFAWPLFPYVTYEIVDEIWQLAVIQTVSGVIAGVTQPKLGAIADKIGRKPVIIFGRAAFFVFPLVYAFASSWLHLLVVHAFLGIFSSAAMVTTTTYILDSAPPGKRATYTASYNFVFGLVTFFGSLIGGIFANVLSMSGVANPIFFGLIISALLRIVTSTSFLKIKETLHKNVKLE